TRLFAKASEQKIPSPPRLKLELAIIQKLSTVYQKSSGFSRSANFWLRNLPSAADLDSRARRIVGEEARFRLASRFKSLFRSISHCARSVSSASFLGVTKEALGLPIADAAF